MVIMKRLASFVAYFLTIFSDTGTLRAFYAVICVKVCVLIIFSIILRIWAYVCVVP